MKGNCDEHINHLFGSHVCGEMFFNFIFCVRFVVCGLASPAILVLILCLAAIAKAPSAISMLLPLFFCICADVWLKATAHLR